MGAATLGVPVKDTIAKVENLQLKEGLDRSLLIRYRLHRAFSLPLLLHIKAASEKFIGTDDAGWCIDLGTM